MTRTLPALSPRIVLHLGAGTLLLGALTACNSARNPFAPKLTAQTTYAVQGAPALRGPLVALPGAGPARLVEDSLRLGGTYQRIAYGRDGASDASLTLGAASIVEKPTRIGIATELAKLQGGPYRVANQPARNAYGPVGIALGERCVYAWQWIDNLYGVDLGTGPAGSSRVSASLRVKHCGGRSTNARLADLARLRIGPVAQNEALRTPRRHRAPKAVAVTAAPAFEPAVDVPVAATISARPSVTVNGSRTLVSVPQDRSAAQLPAYPAGTDRPIVPRPGPTGSDGVGQPRYITDSTTVRAPAALQAPPPQAPARRETLSTDLPAQAYRGPTPPPFGW